jgi:SagB-type dehydrogenase family enzyme
MNKRIFLFGALVLNVLIICVTLISSANQQSSTNAELKTIQLPPPQTDGGKPLMQVLKDRKSSREFSNEKLPPQVLSNLLWAAFGINRQDSKKHTAPSARNRQEIDVYVATTEGIYIYDANSHMLKPVLVGDNRAATGTQEFVKDVPVNLIYVADFSKMGDGSNEDKVFYSATDTGFIAENVYLFCTSEGLATIVRGLIDRPALAKIMKLRPEQKIILSQSVGYPKKQ